MSNRIEVRMIWARERFEPDSPYLIDAWDEFSVDQNEDGWREALAKAQRDNNEVRVTTCFVDFDAVVRAFEPTVVEVDE